MNRPARTLLAGAALAAGGLLFTNMPQAAQSGAEAVSQTVSAKPAAPVRQSPAAVAAQIDSAIDARLAEANIPASAPADDAEFLRRVSLDITGRIPSSETVVSFLESKDADKRAKVVDTLLASPDFGKHFATVWHNLIVPRDSNVRRIQTGSLTEWLADAFNNNLGWDKIVYEIMTAEGAGESNPQVIFWLANGENGRPTPNKITATASQLFLGVQLQCAECHNHPFTKWKQTDFWSMAAFFGRVRTDGGAKGGNKNAELPSLTENANGRGGGKGGKGPQAGPGATITIPESKGKVVKAKLPEGDEPVFRDGDHYRPTLAAWMTSPENKFFANAMVNRMWATFFGRGFVNPVDDFHSGNPASHPALLKALSAEFAASGFDLKHLIRCMTASKAYQRTSRPTPGNENDVNLFSKMAVKVMSPEVMYDSLTLALGGEGQAGKGERGQKNAAGNKKGGQGGPKAVFVNFFTTAEEGVPADEYTHGIPQALRLMNDQKYAGGNSPLVAKAMKSGSPAKGVETLYLSVLSRRPTEAETKRMTDYLAKQSDAKAGWSGVLWVLINGSEFVLNH